MRAVAFAPGHISGFFEPVYNKQDMARTGSCGAGINVSLGAVSEVNVEESTSQIFEIYVNNRQSDSPVVHLALKGLLGEKKVHVVVRTNLDMPVSQGFGMSAASAVSSSYALARIIGASWFKSIASITVPLLKISLTSGWILIFITSFRELSSSILLYSTNSEVIAVTIFTLFEEGEFEALAALSILILCITLIFVAGSRKIVGKGFAQVS